MKRTTLSLGMHSNSKPCFQVLVCSDPSDAHTQTHITNIKASIILKVPARDSDILFSLPDISLQIPASIQSVIAFSHSAIL